MPSIKQATNASWTNPALIGAAAAGAGGIATDVAAGFNPLSVLFVNPLESLRMGMLVNPFQGLGPSGAGLSQFKFGGMWGYKTLLTGVTGPSRYLSAGNIILSAVEGVARTPLAGSLLGDNARVALQHARSLGLAGIVDPGRSVVSLGSVADLIDDALETALGYRKNIFKGEVRWVKKDAKRGSRKWGAKTAAKITRHMDKDKLVRGPARRKLVSMIGDREAPKGVVRKILRAAGEGFDADDVLKGARIVEEGGTYRAIVSASSKKASTLAIKLGKGFAGKAAGLALRGFAAWSWASLAWLALKPLGSAMIREAGGVAASALTLLDEFRSLEISTGRLPGAFMTPGAATERQRAVQAIYQAKVQPSNRFLGNEAQFYHR